MNEHTKHQLFDPRGKSFKQRLDAFLNYAKLQYGVHIGQDHGRTPEWAQTMHVCHMFLYNAFANHKPRHLDTTNKRTISWDYISDPKLSWNLVKYTELLRTANGQPPEKFGAGWKKDMEPDLKKSQERMKQLLMDGGCARGGTAMIACGIAPCGEPCGCPTGRSKHIDGLAADLKMHDLDLLTHKLSVNKAGTLDHLLSVYGLYRPMLHHKTSPEQWHVEAIPPTHHVHHSHPAGHHQAKRAQLEANDMLLPCPHPPRYVV
jgi:hypothetical protein